MKNRRWEQEKEILLYIIKGGLVNVYENNIKRDFEILIEFGGVSQFSRTKKQRDITIYFYLFYYSFNSSEYYLGCHYNKFNFLWHKI